MKIFRGILIIISIIGIIIYNILIQRDILNIDETIYTMVYIYITISIIWIIGELTIFRRNGSDNFKKTKNESCATENREDIFNDFNEPPKYKTDFGDDTMSKISNDLSKNKEKTDIIYCVNCHRQIYSSNYTGSNLCVECKNHYYKK